MDSEQKKKKSPWYLVVLADLLLTGTILCTFAYFHHVRMLWGIGQQNNEEVLLNFTKTQQTENTASVQPTVHTNHVWELAEEVAANCTEGGYKRYTCVCGQEKIDDRSQPMGHDPELRGKVEATDEENGYSGDLVCKVCGEIIQKGEEIPATSHENLTLINQRDASCTQKGYSGDWYCPDCDKIVAYGAETPLLEHTYQKKETVSPTCTDEGFTLYVCTVCGSEKKDEYLPVIDHIMGKNGCCTMCGVNMLDLSGDFGASFPQMFIQNSNKVTLTDSDAILAYAKENGIDLPGHTDGKYIALYRSHDLFVSILEVDTDLYYEGTKKTYHVQYYVYDIYVRNIENLFTSYTVGERVETEKLISSAEQSLGGDVIAAINGDYMGNTNHCLLCERNGNVLRMPERIESDACILYYDGTMETVSPANYNRDRIAAKSPYQIWNFGPGLIDGNGKAVEKYSHVSYDNNIMDSRHPRASIGYYEPGHYNFIIVDGRSDDSQGVRMVQLARLHAEFGSKVAYNLDGGDSAQAYFQDTVIREDEDRGNEQRKLFDIICIGEVSS